MKTYLVQYPKGHRFHDHPDEVDGQDRADAEAQAADLYEPGYTLVEIQPGGSGGLVQRFG
jgi:hypothetical protein